MHILSHHTYSTPSWRLLWEVMCMASSRFLETVVSKLCTGCRVELSVPIYFVVGYLTMLSVTPAISSTSICLQGLTIATNSHRKGCKDQCQDSCSGYAWRHQSWLMISWDSSVPVVKFWHSYFPGRSRHFPYLSQYIIHNLSSHSRLYNPRSSENIIIQV
jgi:hypothetical protein